jgi:hypothetical protein
MKRAHILLAALIFLIALPSLLGQDVEIKDKEKGKDTVKVKELAPPDVPVKVQILLTEFDGTQKLSSLPYTVYTLANAPNSRPHNAHLRFGVKVPISQGSAGQITYQDVGTNIDCTAEQFSDGQYSLDFTVERSSVSMRGSNGEESEWKPGNESPGPYPLLRSFRDNFILIMRDGRTMEGTSAVDPVTGHVLKVEVTLNVLK